MDEIILTIPKKEHEQAAYEYLNEHYKYGEKSLNGAGGLNHADSYDEWLIKLSRDLDYDNIESGRVPASTFFAIRKEDNYIIGMVNIRHSLNEYLLNIGGHIGYGVRPSERRKGYASKMLSMSLNYCRGLGLTKVLVTCNDDNIASSKTIIKNGGILENTFLEDNGNTIERYWILITADN